MHHIKKKQSKKLLWSSVVAVVLIAAAATGVWYYLNNRPNTNPTDSQPAKSGTTDEQTHPDSIKLPEDVDPSSVKPYTLVTENEAFKIRELDGNYLITLYAIINRPEQSEQYYDQLRQYKQQALDYLQDQSIDTTKVNIQYEPAEANDL